MTTSSSETAAEPAADINAIVAGLRALHVRSTLDGKASTALNTVLNNHATGARKLILAILGPSGVGKTETIAKLLSGERVKGKVISLVAPSPASVKTLGVSVVNKLGQPFTRRQMDEQAFLDMVKAGLGAAETLVLHVDEAQHLLTSGGDITLTRTLDALKLLVQDPHKVVLVLTGTDRVAEVFARDDQLHERTVYVEANRLSVNEDSSYTGKVLRLLCSKAGLEMGWVDADRLPQRITHAGRTFGLAVSLIIDAIELELRAGRKILTRESFATVYARDRDVGGDLNPFVAIDFLAIDPSRRTAANNDKEDRPKAKRGRPKSARR